MKKSLFALISVLLCFAVLLASCQDDGEISKNNTSNPSDNSYSDIVENNSEGAIIDNSQTDGNNESNNSVSGGDNNNDSGNNSSNENNNSKPSDNNTEVSVSPEGDVEYSVNAIDGKGNPISGLIVKINGETFSGMKTTSAKGVAKFTAKKGEFTIEFVSPAKDYYYDTTKCVLDDDTFSITVILLEKAVASTSVNAYSKTKGDYTDHKAYEISEGMLYAPIEKDEITYFIFTPERSGIYEITASGSGNVFLGYYGMPLFVYTDSLAEIQDNKFELEIHNYHVGTSKDTTTSYVLGIHTAGGEKGDCVLSVVRTGDAPISIEDMPWQVAVADEKYLIKYNGEEGKELVDIDIFTEPKIVLNEQDGYYHYGTADGPLVLVRLNSDAQFLSASLYDICSTSTFGVYVYDDNGEFQYKERYNELIEQYLEICDENGVCPLNPQLAEIIKAFGNQKGWWESSTSPGYIFGKKPAYKHQDYAWLFCCCYYN